MKQKRFWTLILLFIIGGSFLMVDWSANTFHGNGFDTLKKIGFAALTPDISILPSALSAALITIVYAVTGLSVAIVMGFLISLVAAGLLLKRFSKPAQILLSGMRAIHELVWALFFVASIGLKPLAAIFAIAIPYAGMLGKVYTNIFNSVDSVKITALKHSGASHWQLIIFGYLPEAYNNLVSYTLYRLECAIRSSSILSFVGLAGLGLKIQLTLGDLAYHQTFMYIYTLVTIVFVIDYWGNLHRKLQSKDKITGKVIALLIICSWLYVGIIDKAFFYNIFTLKNYHYSTEFIKQLLGFYNENPAFFNIKEIQNVFVLSLETLQMSIIAITLASIGMIVTVILATRQYTNKVLYFVMRGLYLITRAIPELIWAMIIVFILKPGIWAGALALAIHNFGILSKLCAEVIEDLKEAPIANLKSSGAHKAQVLIFAVLPSAMKKIIGFIIYRWEVILRTTIVVGFIGAGGLGYYFKTHMSWFHYTHVTLVLIAYFVLVRLTDYIGKKLNELYN